METARHERLIGGPKIGVAIDGGAAEVCSVISLLEAEVLGARGLAFDLMILAREAQGGFD